MQCHFICRAICWLYGILVVSLIPLSLFLLSFFFLFLRIWNLTTFYQSIFVACLWHLVFRSQWLCRTVLGRTPTTTITHTHPSTLSHTFIQYLVLWAQIHSKLFTPDERVTDSNCNCPFPLTDNMRALTMCNLSASCLLLKMILNVMGRPNIKSSDIRAFKASILQV